MRFFFLHPQQALVATCPAVIFHDMVGEWPTGNFEQILAKLFIRSEWEWNNLSRIVTSAKFFSWPPNASRSDRVVWSMLHRHTHTHFLAKQSERGVLRRVTVPSWDASSQDRWQGWSFWWIEGSYLWCFPRSCAKLQKQEAPLLKFSEVMLSTCKVKWFEITSLQLARSWTERNQHLKHNKTATCPSFHIFFHIF